MKWEAKMRFEARKLKNKYCFHIPQVFVSRRERRWPALRLGRARNLPSRRIEHPLRRVPLSAGRVISRVLGPDTELRAARKWVSPLGLRGPNEIAEKGGFNVRGRNFRCKTKISVKARVVDNPPKAACV